LWCAVRALEESATLTQRLAGSSSGPISARFEEKEQEQRRQAEVIKQLLHSRASLSVSDAAALLTSENAADDDNA
jgi:hypothetical protein